MATKLPSSTAKEMSRATVCTSPEGARKRTVTSSKATACVLMPSCGPAARPAPALRLDAELGVRLLDELVGIGRLDVDLGGLDLGNELAEHGEHHDGGGDRALPPRAARGCAIADADHR